MSRVLVDTSIWSLALRRSRPGSCSAAERVIVLHWAELVRDNRAILIGAVRQEILTGIRDAAQFERLRDNPRGFDEVESPPDDYEQAAQFSNTCRAAGVMGSPTDFLICSVAVGRGVPVYATDPDFTRYAAHLPIQLYAPASAAAPP